MPDRWWAGLDIVVFPAWPIGAPDCYLPRIIRSPARRQQAEDVEGEGGREWTYLAGCAGPGRGQQETAGDAALCADP